MNIIILLLPTTGWGRKIVVTNTYTSIYGHSHHHLTGAINEEYDSQSCLVYVCLVVTYFWKKNLNASRPSCCFLHTLHIQRIGCQQQPENENKILYTVMTNPAELVACWTGKSLAAQTPPLPPPRCSYTVVVVVQYGGNNSKERIYQI